MRNYLEKLTSPDRCVYFSSGDLDSRPRRYPFTGKAEDCGLLSLLKGFIYIWKDKNKDLGFCPNSKGFSSFFSEREKR